MSLNIIFEVTKLKEPIIAFIKVQLHIRIRLYRAYFCFFKYEINLILILCLYIYEILFSKSHNMKSSKRYLKNSMIQQRCFNKNEKEIISFLIKIFVWLCYLYV